MQSSSGIRYLLLSATPAMPFAAAGPVRAQTAATPGQIWGRVVNQSTGRPVAAVLFTLEGAALTTESSERGLFVFRGVPSGTWQLRAERIGYPSRTGTVETRPGAMVDGGSASRRNPSSRHQHRVRRHPGLAVEMNEVDRPAVCRGNRSRRMWVVLAALACSATACDRGAGNAADVDVLPAITATRDLRIGSADDPDAGFSRIGAVAVDGEGSIYVFELADSKIRVYDHGGTFLRAIGGQGRGPGEFEYVQRFGVTGDTLWTIDYGLRRITLFDRRGSVLSTGTMNGVTVQLPNQQMAGMVMPHAMRTDGLFTSEMSLFVSRRGQPDNDVGEGDTVQVPRVLFDATGVVVDTIGSYPFPPRSQTETKYIEAGPTRYVVPRPPTDEPLDVKMSAGGFLIDRTRAGSAEPATFTVTRLTEAGDTVFTRRYTYTPHHYPDAVLDTIAWRSARIPGGFYNPATGPARTPEGVDIDVVRNTIRSSMSFPEYQIPVESGVAGDDGSLWLRREDDGGQAAQWMVFEPDGEILGVVELPRAMLPRWLARDSFIGVELDEMDVPWLVRYRLGA